MKDITIVLTDGQAMHLMNMINIELEKTEEDYGETSEEVEFMQELKNVFDQAIPPLPEHWWKKQ